ncbi:MAG TPA: cobalt transporter CbiM [Candidatus Methanoperedens sp.]
MHIPDGYIPLDQAAVYWIIALIFIARSIKWARKDMKEDMLPLMAVVAAGMFVLQSINIAANLLIPIPVMGGVSWHVVGAALIAIIFASPWAAVLLMTLVLGVQSLLFGDGGFTVMGANIMNMGIIGGFMGYYGFIGLSKLSIKRPVAMFISAWASMILPAIALAFELWLAGTFPLKQGVLLMGIFQGVAGIGEGIITIIVFSAIIRAKPEMITEDAHKKVSAAKVAVFGIIALSGLAIAAPFLASGDPDGLGRTASMVIKEEISNTVSPIKPLFPGYSIPGMGKTGEVAAIVIGLAVMLLLWLGITKLLRRT